MNPTANLWRNKPGFADLYLERYSSGPGPGLPEPDPDLFLSVVIPSFKEPDIAGSVRSLLNCHLPGVVWEIIVVINFPENSSAEIRDISRLSMDCIQEISRESDRSDVRIHTLWCPDLAQKHAGVGLARKIGMDAAIRRFNQLERPEGIIVSFDADSTCDVNYLTGIAGFYRVNPQARAANLFFEHPLEGELPSENYASIAEYELYLRYLRLALELTGHPHAIHTVGSSFSVRASTYTKVNGMGRHRAGEDFYFLHKCIQLGRFYEINTPMVIPSPRQSDRVIFGTGAAIQKQAGRIESLAVYSLDSIESLSALFSLLPLFFSKKGGSGKARVIPELMSDPLHSFLAGISADQQIAELVRTSNTYPVFRNRFFAWFNGFMVLRFLNAYHASGIARLPVLAEANKLASKAGIDQDTTACRLLINYRNFEKGRGIRRVT
ncbi:MAG TPA: family 2 glycosyl transferase [Bacteroidales bacterium]|nr:family 2 glycosyl transferase [Bacteroidales bacterium]